MKQPLRSLRPQLDQLATAESSAVDQWVDLEPRMQEAPTLRVGALLQDWRTGKHSQLHSVAALKVRITNVTYQSHVIVFQKLGCHGAFGDKEVFTRHAPSLQIRRVATVFHKAHDFVFSAEHVTANDRRRTITVGTADYESR